MPLFSRRSSKHPPRARARRRDRQLRMEQLESRALLSAQAPVELRVMPGTISGEVFAAWEMPAGTSTAAITDFAVQASADNGLSWQAVDDGISTQPYASLTGLDPSQSLVIRVAALTSEGIGPWSAYSAVVSPSGANSETSVEFVHVGDAGNTNDSTGYGAVDHEYRIMRFEWTNSQYVQFLNAIDPDGTNPNGVYATPMGSDARGGISFDTNAASGSKYASKTNMGNKPVTFISWFEAARVSNWLHNGALTYGSSDSSADAPQNTGAYAIGRAHGGPAPSKNAGALYWVPMENEWYKAAYYNPTLNNGKGGYTIYGNGFDTAPTAVTANEAGDGTAGQTGNFANYNNGAIWNDQVGNVTTVGTNGAASYYGAFDMSGNVVEWNDLADETGSRGRRDGFWSSTAYSLSSSGRVPYRPPGGRNTEFGFRLASPFSPQAFVASSLFSSPFAVAASMTGAAATLTWQPPQLEGSLENLSYAVQQSSDGGQTWTTATNSLTASATSYQFTDLQADQQYLFRVAARSAAGVGAFSEAVAPVAVPSAPSNLSATAGNAQASLTWTTPSSDGGAAISDYVIQYSSNGGSTWTTFNREASTATTATVTGLTNGTSYLFRVAAVNSVGTGAYSASPSSVTPTAVPFTHIVFATSNPLFAGVAIRNYVPGEPGLNPDLLADLNTANTRPEPLEVEGVWDISFQASGLWSHHGSQTGPSGNLGSLTSTHSQYEFFGIAGLVNAPINSLVGVFTDSTVAELRGPRPDRIDHAAGRVSEPGLNQVFHIGASDEPIRVPAGATKLYLGLHDAHTWNDNSGQLSVIVIPRNTPALIPTVPTSVLATAGDSQARLTWTAPSSDGGASITSYVIQFSSDNGGNWTTFNRATSTATSATVTGLTNGTSYLFRVAAVNSVGTGLYAGHEVAVTPSRDGFFAPLVKGVSSVASPGNPGALSRQSEDWMPIVRASDAATNPSTFAMARQFNGGRVVALSHSELFGHPDLFDNGIFLENIFGWLDLSNARQVRYTTGHSEWGWGQLGGMQQRLVGQGYTVSSLAGTVVTNDLTSASVLVVREAATAFSSEEVAALVDFVSRGGGLLLIGVGWAWEPYNPGSSIEFFPMNLIGREFSIQWTRDVVVDPSNELPGVTPVVFTTLFPNAASVASKPSSMSATAGNAQASLTWTAPSSDGGAPITDYVIQYYGMPVLQPDQPFMPTPVIWTTFNREASTATTATVTGLTNGTAYVFRVAAVNSVGTGPFSVNSNSVTPRVPPAIDLNGNGVADLIWQSTDGVAIAWLDGNPNARRVLGGGGGWTLASTGDFNADGVTDLVWRNSAGVHVVWLMNANGTTASQRLLGGGGGWELEATGDYNGDGRTDIIWRNAFNGANVMWLMNGGSPIAQAVLGGDRDWRLVATDERFDSNGDGKTDLIWRSAAAGVNVLWRMNGSSLISARGFGGDGNWRIVGTGDFDGDGNSDVLWRHGPSGSVFMWLLDASGNSHSQAFIGGGTSRDVTATKDANGDGKTDIFWRTLATGETERWLMSGTTATFKTPFGGNLVWRLLGRPGNRMA
jgi:formylglycine-generating enzyme required for sulfatase activity